MSLGTGDVAIARSGKFAIAAAQHTVQRIRLTGKPKVTGTRNGAKLDGAPFARNYLVEIKPDQIRLALPA